MATQLKPEPRVRLRSQAMPFVGVASSIAQDLYHPLVQAVLHILRELIASGGARLVGRDADAPDAERALFERLTDTEGFYHAVRHLASAHVAGVAVAEIVWDEDYHPRQLRPIPIERVQLGLDEYGEVVSVRVQTSAGLQNLPLSNTLFVIHGSWHLYPSRELPLQALQKYLRAYDRVLRSIDLYLQRHATPTALAKTPAAYTAEESEQLFQALVKMQEALVAVIPDPATVVEFLEPKGTGMQLGLEMLNLLERLVARTLLGSVLAVYDAQYGTRAQAQVHWEVTQRLISALQQPIERALNQQLWKPYCTYQLGREPISQLQLNELESVNRAELIRNLGDLVALGMVDPEADRAWLRALLGLSEGQ